MWASAAACMRNYLILRDKVSAFRSDPDVVAALRDAASTSWRVARSTPARRSPNCATNRSTPMRGAAGDGVRAARPARPRAPVRHEALTLVAGVDSSTSATKVVVRDVDDGRVVASGSRPHPATQPPRSEQDPAAWWAAFEGAWADAGSPDVAAIAVAGQQHGLVVLDGDRSVVRSAKLWNDTESAADAAWLIDQLEGGAAAWAAACGSVPVAALTITKLSWLHRREPESWDRLAHVVLPHDWLTAQLTGRLTTDRGDASGTGYWSPADDSYRFDLLDLVDSGRDWAGVVPDVLGPREHAGEWRGAVVAPGTGDNMAGALGIGLRPGDVAVSLGTSGTVYTVSDPPPRTRREPSLGSPTPPGCSCRWCAR